MRRALTATLNVLIGVRAAHIWWQLWGGSTPALQYVGMRVTAQTTAASATEELWSEYDFVVNQRRTRLLKGIMISIIDLVEKNALCLKAVS